MKAWIGNLAAYNAGAIKGAWVEISDDEDDNAALIARHGGEEHYIADYDDCPGALARHLGEYAGAADLACAVTLWGAMLRCAGQDADLASEMLDAYVDRSDYMAPLAQLVEGAADFVSDCYAGMFDTLKAFGEDYCDETGILDSIPEQYRGYFDCEAYARDLEIGGAISTHRGSAGLLVFWSR